MPLIDKLNAIADAVRERAGITGELTIDDMIAAIGQIEGSSQPGAYIAPASSKYRITNKFSALGNAIREKSGGSAPLTLAEMPDAIREISGDFEYAPIYDNPTSPARTIIAYEIIGPGSYRKPNMAIPMRYNYKDVTRISRQAFQGCDWIKTLTLYSSLDEVGGEAFRDCINLEKVSFVDRGEPFVTPRITVYSGAFRGCIRLTEVNHSNVIVSCTCDVSRELGYDKTFADCPVQIVRAYDYHTWQQSTYRGYYPGASLIFEKQYSYFGSSNNCAYCYAGLTTGVTMYRCGMNSFSLSDGYNLAYWDELETLDLAYGNTGSLAPGVCSGCSNLKEVIFPDTGSYTYIGQYAFAGCTSLKTVTLWSQQVGYGVFSNSGLEEAFFGKSVYLQDDSFRNCSNLKQVTFKNMGVRYDDRDKPYLKNAFTNCPNLTDIYVFWSEGEVEGAPWGATNATIHYNHTA